MLARLHERRGGVNLVILDACRNDPGGGSPRGFGDALGFAEPAGPQAVGDDVILWFSTSPGEVALDGPDKGTSPFAEALTQTLTERGSDDLDAIRRTVQRRVKDATAARQVPHIFDYTDKPFSFVESAPPPTPEREGPVFRAAIITVSTVDVEGSPKQELQTELPPLPVVAARAEDEPRARVRPGMTTALPVDDIEVGDVLRVDAK